MRVVRPAVPKLKKNYLWLSKFILKWNHHILHWLWLRKKIYSSFSDSCQSNHSWKWILFCDIAMRSVGCGVWWEMIRIVRIQSWKDRHRYCTGYETLIFVIHWNAFSCQSNILFFMHSGLMITVVIVQMFLSYNYVINSNKLGRL